jgi:ATP-dependent protease Clp ATPase subunit
MSSQRTNTKDLINRNRREGDSATIKYINQENVVYPHYKLEEQRLEGYKKMTENKIDFKDKKIYLLGFGGIGRPLLYQILKTIKVKPENILITDMRDVSKEAEYFTN